MNELINKGKKAKEVSFILSNLSTLEKNKGLNAMANSLVNNKEEILKANKIDLQASMEKGTSKSMLDRLALTEERIEGMSNGLRQVVALPDPIGEVLGMWTRPNGLQIGQKRVPLGVIGIIYEARPNVTSDAAGLCFKAGNAVILRGGSEAINSNKAIVKVLREGLKSVIETGTGNCHIYVDEYADFEMAKNIVINAKTSRPSVCNAAEKLLVHEKIAKDFIPIILKALRDKDVEIRGDKSSIAYDSSIKKANKEEWYNEYLDYIIGVKVVNDIDEAIDIINHYGSGHSEAIITKDYDNSQKFLQKVDAAAVYVNASTRFTDGEEFGFGAEIGISTQKLHARGPMGLKELTTIKYIIYGNGQIR